MYAPQQGYSQSIPLQDEDWGWSIIPKARGTFDVDGEIQITTEKNLIFLKLVRISMKASALLSAIFESVFI